MKLYVLRHGETVWNRAGIIQGKSQNRLSKMGKQQAENVGKIFADKNIDLIISSPIFRTIQTANIVNKYVNKKLIKDSRITETDQGIYTKIKKQNLTSEQRAKKNMHLKEDGMESYLEVYKRVENFIQDIKIKYTNNNLLIVTHQLPAQFFEVCLIHKKYVDKSLIKPLTNAEFREFEL